MIIGYVWYRSTTMSYDQKQKVPIIQQNPIMIDNIHKFISSVEEMEDMGHEVIYTFENGLRLNYQKSDITVKNAWNITEPRALEYGSELTEKTAEKFRKQRVSRRQMRGEQIKQDMKHITEIENAKEFTGKSHVQGQE